MIYVAFNNFVQVTGRAATHSSYPNRLCCGDLSHSGVTTGID